MQARRSLVVTVVLMVASVLAGACDSDGGGGGGSGGGGGEEGEATGAVCPTTQTLTFGNFGKAFMQSYCLRCHSKDVTGEKREGAPADHNFDTVDEIRGLAEHIDELAGAGPNAVNAIMPEGDPRPSEAERKKLSEWLACGAP